jgi:hypothetical protein
MWQDIKAEIKSSSKTEHIQKTFSFLFTFSHLQTANCLWSVCDILYFFLFFLMVLIISFSCVLYEIYIWNKSDEKKIFSILISSIHMGFIVLILNKVSYWCIMHLKLEFVLNRSSFNSGFKTNRFPVFIKFQNGNNSVFFQFITRSFWCISNAFRNFLTGLKTFWSSVCYMFHYMSLNEVHYVLHANYM